MKKIVLLITGQKTRLELYSKIKNIITPLSTDYEIIVVLSLSDSNNFTNMQKYKKDFKHVPVDIEKMLGTIPYHINNIVYPELSLNNKLVSMLDKKNLGENFKINRANNHVRQYYTLSDSWSIVKSLNPDILIKIRDDAAVYEPLTLTKFHQLTSRSKKCILTPSDNHWGGINDKFAIVSKEAIEPFLTKPLEIYNSHQNFKKNIDNPEKFLQYVYSWNKLLMGTFNIKIKIVGQ